MSDFTNSAGEPITPREAAGYARSARDDGPVLALLHIGDQLARIADAMEADVEDRGRTFRVSG